MVRQISAGSGKTRRAWVAAGVLAVGLLWAASFWSPWGQVSQPSGEGADMPEFTTTSQQLWINSKPLRKDALKGKVVLLEVWTSI